MQCPQKIIYRTIKPLLTLCTCVRAYKADIIEHQFDMISLLSPITGGGLAVARRLREPEVRQVGQGPGCRGWFRLGLGATAAALGLSVEFIKKGLIR